jgi:subtilisin family serine protease
VALRTAAWRLSTLAGGSALALALTGGALTQAAAADPAGAVPARPLPARADAPGSTVDPTSAIVRLSSDPLSVNAAAEGTIQAQQDAFAAWLHSHAPSAKVSGEYDAAVNAVAVRLHGTPLKTLLAAPGVVSADHQTLYTPAAQEDPDLRLIDATAGWAAARPPGGRAKAGAGVKVGVIDTGIDQSHPCFDDAGYPAAKQLGDARFTNNKVVVARVFSSTAGATPEAVQTHGTHVAGTVACNAHTPADVQGVDIPYAPSGVAPGALLGNYNVFPGQVANARTEDILNALQAAYHDGMTVINMSLGGPPTTPDLLSAAVDNLDAAGVVVAAAAGNDGPGRSTVGSPGLAASALTAGASSVGHYVGSPVAHDGTTLAVAAIGDFPTPSDDLTAPLSQATGAPLGLGCAAGDFTDVTGTITLVARGSCTFGAKVANAEHAGAKAVIVVNNVPGDPVAMAADPANPSTIPAVMAGLAQRGDLLDLLGQDVTIRASKTYTDTGNDNIVAEFSARGPTGGDFRVKPDVVAPGVNVLSAFPQRGCSPLPARGCWAFLQGTSMATPHLAGMAAVVRQAHPRWQPWQVRSAVVNTARQGVLKQGLAPATTETDVQVVGAGLADLDAAVRARVAVAPVSTSFGAVPAGATTPVVHPVKLTNLTGRSLRLPLSVRGDRAFSVSPSTVRLAAGGSQVVAVTYDPGVRPATGDRQATLRIGRAAHAVLYARQL